MTTSPIKKFFIVAGETSGDIHAAHLVEHIKKLYPNTTFEGLGGPRMAEQGVHLYQDMTKIAIMGFIEVLLHYGKFRRAFYLTLDKVRKNKPDAVILVDFPGFNLKLAPKLKKYGVKVIYYISPKLWAWKEDRVQVIKEYVDQMLVLFDFEKDFYARHGIKASFVGNPLIDHVKPTVSKEKFLNSLDLFDYKLTIGILPGSRKKEIELIFPEMVKAMHILKNKYPQLQFLIIKAPSIEKPLLEKYLPETQYDIRIVDGKNYNALNACDLCITKSGTATLETGLLQKPMVIVYKASFISYAIAKLFVKIPYIGLVNIILNKPAVPELIQSKASGKNIAYELEQIFTHELRLADIKSDLKKIPELLGKNNASQQAAKEILKLIS